MFQRSIQSIQDPLCPNSRLCSSQRVFPEGLARFSCAHTDAQQRTEVRKDACDILRRVFPADKHIAGRQSEESA